MASTHTQRSAGPQVRVPQKSGTHGLAHVQRHLSIGGVVARHPLGYSAHPLDVS